MDGFRANVMIPRHHFSVIFGSRQCLPPTLDLRRSFLRGRPRQRRDIHGSSNSTYSKIRTTSMQKSNELSERKWTKTRTVVDKSTF